MLNNIILAAEEGGAAGIESWNFSGLENGVVKTVASVIIAFFVVRMAMAYARRAWGEMVGEIFFVLVVGYVAWFPDNAEATLKAIAGGITGAA